MLRVDMPMPPCCEKCDVEIYGVCGVTHEDVLNEHGEYEAERPSWCPIKGELVLCGECIRHEEPRDTSLKAFVWCNFYNTHKLKNGYCNCGERKGG